MAERPACEQADLERTESRKEAHQAQHQLIEHFPHPYLENGNSTPTLSGSRIAAAHQVRSTKVLERISFARSKGILDRAVEQVEKRRQDEHRAQSKARKDAATQERKTRREEENRAKREKRQESRDRAIQNKKLKAERKAQEKQVQDYYGIRGYDPSAGILRSNRERAAQRTPDGQIQTSQNIDEALNLRPRSSQTWGVEYGKPKESGIGRHSTS
ncbi:hypothetical protein FOPE_12462 [Fonsecaea pedrosoi]|nr:hypothetical protein FOPE_12462 [Fonsecaea pedrosoi]